MHTLVVYDSQFGNTERIARMIATTFSEFGIHEQYEALQQHLAAR